MSQPLDDKCRALETLIPAMLAYLHLHPAALKIGRYETGEGDKGTSPPVWMGLDCDGRCPGCEYERDCRGDAWEFAKLLLERKHRMNVIAAAYARMDRAASQLATAVRAVYVERYDRDFLSEPVHMRDRTERDRWARAGVRYMARNIKGELVPMDEKPRTKAEKVEELVTSGVTSPTTIAVRVGCTVRHAKRLKAAVLVRRGRTLSAEG